MQTANIDEVFASIQGEGPWVGQRHIFIRFMGCDLRCGYCDTPEAAKSLQDSSRPCRAQRSRGSFDRESIPNPLTPDRVSELCERLVVPGQRRPVISLTGGEPLLHREFLALWLPMIKQRYRVYLETNGIQHAAMSALAHLVDIVSMDIKLPSATGQAERWDDHRKFLEASSRADVFAKVVVTRDTAPSDFRKAVSLLEKRRISPAFIIQPASGMQAPTAEFLVGLQNQALETLADVRVIPQVHKMLLVP